MRGPEHGLLSFATITIKEFTLGGLARIPHREPIIIEIPPVLCETPDCPNPRQFDMVLLLLDEGTIHILQVCGRHAFLWRGVSPTNFFPLNTSPPLPWIKDQVEQEIARRRPPQPQVYFNTTNYYGGTGTGNWGGFNIRFS